MVRLWCLIAGAAISVASATTYPTVDTIEGPVIGGPSTYRPGVTVYKGIPFAAPPVGKLRFQPPNAAANRTKVLNATSYGPQCMQTVTDAGIFTSGQTSMSEDCLYLNIWTPTYDNFTDLSTLNLPVYFWIYGGRYEMGSGDVLTYDGSGLASKGIIVVTVNYRVGPFGFMAHPLLSAESPNNSSGNYGVLDQIAGLKWVHDNIANFGGNPDQIVTGGQSAGSASSLIMTYSPLSRDYVAGAISESGACAPHDPNTASIAVAYRMKDEAEQLGIPIWADLNVTTTAELRNLSADALVAIQSMNEEMLDGTKWEGWNADPPMWRPVIDGWVLTKNYENTLGTNDHGDVPIMTGFNKDEGVQSINATQYVEDYTQWMGNFSDAFFKLWPGGNDTEATNSVADFKRVLMRTSSWLYATQWNGGGATSNVYTYFFTSTPQEDYEGGSYHGAELWYTFNNIPYADYTANLTWPLSDYEIEANMSSYWVNFISTGNPNGDGLAQWDPTTKEGKKTMYLGNTYGEEDVGTDAKRDFVAHWFASLHAW